MINRTSPFTPTSGATSATPQRLLLAITLSGALLAGLMSVAFAAEPAASTTSPTTRAAVLQDLKAYQDSGLAALERDDSQSQVGTEAWKQARRRYLTLTHMAINGAKPLTREQVLEDLRRYEASGLAQAQQRDGEQSTISEEQRQALARYEQLSMTSMNDKPLSRAEVLADLQIYRESGLAAFDRSEGDFSRSSPDYVAARQRYETLKRGDRYQTLVSALGTATAQAH
jgi:hypothetical protein